MNCFSNFKERRTQFLSSFYELLYEIPTPSLFFSFFSFYREFCFGLYERNIGLIMVAFFQVAGN
jgi:hypothetical protein